MIEIVKNLPTVACKFGLEKKPLNAKKSERKKSASKKQHVIKNSSTFSKYF